MKLVQYNVQHQDISSHNAEYTPMYFQLFTS